MPLKQYFVLLLSLVGVALSMHVNAQGDATAFNKLTIAHGLSQNEVTCVYQDSKGFLWIGTKAGLNRYDGRNFKIFKNDPLDSKSISHNTINGMCEDKQSNLWIATDKGLNKFNRTRGNFDVYLPDEELPSSLTEAKVYSVICDDNGVIWAKTKRFLERFDARKNDFRHFEHYYDLFNPLTESVNYPLFIDSQKMLWVGTNDGLNIFDENLEQFFRFEHEALDKNSISNNEIRCIYQDKLGSVWIGTANGLNRYNSRKKKFTRFYYNPIESNKNSVNSISEDSKGNLWLATDNGLMKFSPFENVFTSHMHSVNNPNSILSNNVNVVFRDYSDILWIGTRSGLNKLDVKKKKFAVYRNNRQDNILTSNDITAIVEKNDSIFLGTRSSGVNLLLRSENKTLQFTYENGDIIDDHINCMAESNTGELLIGTNRGLQLYSPEAGRFINYFKKHPCINMPFILGKKIMAIHHARNNDLWIGTNQGLFKADAKERKLISFSFSYNAKNSLSSNLVNCIFEDSRGIIWIGTNNGVNVYDSERNTFIVYDSETSGKQGLSDNSVHCIAEDNKGYIWIGTSAGLNKFDRWSNTYSYYAEKEGLPDNQIFYIINKDSTLWISTNKGVASLFLHNDSIRSYSLVDGLQGYEFNLGAGEITQNGEMFFGGINGLNAFFPDSLEDNPILPKIAITSLNVFTTKGKFNYFIELENEIILPYDNHNFTIEFAALEFTQPYQNRYKYKMIGLDDQWIDIENMNFASFSNLPSGSYTFKVIGSNSDNKWNEKGVELRIEIETPLWRNKWAYLFYLLLVGLIIYMYIEYRTRTLRKANKNLREKQQAAMEISRQREELSIKNKNITDSITYAKRIQWAIMPSRTKFFKLIPNSFILYMPKDIVSGDFYWVTEIENKIFVAAVDCTGHGVPGAFMSIIGFDLLRNITKEKRVHKPSEIVDKLHVELKKLLSKNIIDGEVKDGMDLSICVFNKDTCMLEYAGAFNPLYIIRNNNIITIKGDRFSVGLGNYMEEVKFTNHEIKIQKDDRVYMFTDGYADQFGGPNGKKMKYRRYRHLLLSIHKLPYTQQQDYLQQYFTTWQGQLEQVDDILVMGMDFNNYLEGE